MFINLLVGGFKHFLIFHNMWDNPSHWLIFFRGVKPPTSLVCGFKDDIFSLPILGDPSWTIGFMEVKPTNRPNMFNSRSPSRSQHFSTDEISSSFSSNCAGYSPLHRCSAKSDAREDLFFDNIFWKPPALCDTEPCRRLASLHMAPQFGCTSPPLAHGHLGSIPCVSTGRSSSVANCCTRSDSSSRSFPHSHWCLLEAFAWHSLLRGRPASRWWSLLYHQKCGFQHKRKCYAHGKNMAVCLGKSWNLCRTIPEMVERTSCTKSPYLHIKIPLVSAEFSPESICWQRRGRSWQNRISASHLF